MIKAEWTNKDALDFCNEFATDCISRQAAIDALCNRCDLVHDVPCTEECNDIKILRKLPSVDRTKGKWVWNPNGMDWNLGAWVCSECRCKPETWWECDERFNPLNCGGSNFCGNCGADMRGDEE